MRGHYKLNKYARVWRGGWMAVSGSKSIYLIVGKAPFRS